MSSFTPISATIGPCGAKSMPVLYRSFDSLSGSDIQRRSQGSQEVSREMNRNITAEIKLKFPIKSSQLFRTFSVLTAS